MAVNELNSCFLSDAEKCTSFDLKIKDFQSISNKKEIQHLFTKHWFPKTTIKFIDEKSINQSTVKKVNSLIKKLKQANKTGFEQLHKYPLKGVGPAEITLYYLFNHSVLGGGSSAGVDITIGSNNYEIKAALNGRVGKLPGIYMHGFKLGGTFSLNDIFSGIYNIHGKKSSEISRSIIDGYRQDGSLKKVEEAFQKLTYEKYFKNHPIIFVNNNKNSSIGEILTVKKVEQKDIFIDAVTSGTIKPAIRFT